MSQSWWRKTIRKMLTRPVVESARRPLRVEWLEDRTTPASIFAVASDPGTITAVAAFDATTRAQLFSVTPYPGFSGGANVAIGDVNGDGTADVITAPKAGGGPTINVYSGVDGTLLKTFTVGDAGSRFGASVAAADYDGDGLSEIVVGTMRNGQPLVQVLKFADLAVLHGYTPFTGANGVSVAAGDVTGDNIPDTIVGAGPGGAPQVTVFNGQTDAVVMNLFTFETSFRGGITVAAGDLNGDSRVDIITAANFLGGPRVQAFNGSTQAVMLNFFAYDSGLRAGVGAAVMDTAKNGQLNVVTVNGSGQPTDLKAFDGRTLATLTAPAIGGLPATTGWDTVAPLPTLTSTAAATTKDSPFPVRVAFPDAVNGFAVGDIAVTNGAASNFVKVDGRTYTFDVTPAGEGIVSVTVIAGAVTDAAGNVSVASSALSRTFDSTGPTVTANPLTTNDTTPTLTGTVGEATATVSVTVLGQTFAATVTGTTWTATLPSAIAAGTYDIVATATDSTGNTATTTATNGLVIDLTPPNAEVTSTAPEPTSTAPIPFKVTFDEDVTGFTAADVAVTNGTVMQFVAVNAREYTFNVAPSGQAVVSVAVNPNVASDAAGNGNTAATAVTRTFDTGALTVTADRLTTSDPTPTLTGTVDDPAATVEVTVDGQTVTATVTGTTWSAAIPTALAEGTYDILVEATNAASNTGTLTLTGGLVVDLTSPTVQLTTLQTSPTNVASLRFTATFSEDVTNFDLSDVGIVNAVVSNFTVVDARTYKFDVAPEADGIVTVTLDAGAALDAAGNPSAAGSGSITSDRTIPSPTITAAENPSNDSPITFTVTFLEDVTDVNNAAFTATNGSVGTVTPQGARTFLVSVTPTADGPVKLLVGATAVKDLAGNGSTAAEFTVTSDRTVPSGTVAATATTNITGTAADGASGSGIQKVEVSVEDTTTNLFWDFAAATPGFTSATEVFGNATSTSGATFATWSIPFTTTAGSYAGSARITDNAGNATVVDQTVVVS